MAVLAPAGAPLPEFAARFDVPADAEVFARRLYAALREADAQGFDVILAAPPPGSAWAWRSKIRRAPAAALTARG